MPVYVHVIENQGQLRVRALDPEPVWLAHEREPWRTRTGSRGSTVDQRLITLPQAR